MFSRQEILQKFHAIILRKEPLIGGGADTELSTKCNETGGADFFVNFDVFFGLCYSN